MSLFGSLALVAAMSAAPAGDAGSVEQDDGFVFRGRAAYLGGGVSALTRDSGPSPTIRLALAFDLSQHWLVEAGLWGMHWSAADVDGSRVPIDTVVITTGLRLAASPSMRLRPYVAARFVHAHHFPDPWSVPDDPTAPIDSGGSTHRFGGALGTGIDAGVLSAESRYRMTLDASFARFSGAGPAYAMSTVLLFGVAF